MKATIKNQEEQAPQLDDNTSNHYMAFEDYEDLIEEEDKFDIDIKEILKYVSESDMMDLQYENGRDLDLDLLRNWKSMFGKLYVSRITDDPVLYIWRPLLRLEYKQMIGSGIGKNDGTVNWSDDFLRQNEILKKCLLFPKPTEKFLRGVRAGIPQALEQQISYQSGFVAEQLVVQSIEMLG